MRWHSNIYSYLKSFCILAVDVKTNVTIKRQTSISLLKSFDFIESVSEGFPTYFLKIK